MIWQPFIIFSADFLQSVLDHIAINIFILEQLFDAFYMLFGALGYFFPITELMPILRISIAISVARIFVAVIRFFKGFIPTMGG